MPSITYFKNIRIYEWYGLIINISFKKFTKNEFNNVEKITRNL